MRVCIDLYIDVRALVYVCVVGVCVSMHAYELMFTKPAELIHRWRTK